MVALRGHRLHQIMKGCNVKCEISCRMTIMYNTWNSNPKVLASFWLEEIFMLVEILAGLLL